METTDQTKLTRKIRRAQTVALIATVLIWAGVFLLGAGLVMAYMDLQAEMAGSAEQPVVLAVTAPATATPIQLTPTITPTNEPSPTPVPPTPTPTPAPPSILPSFTDVTVRLRGVERSWLTVTVDGIPAFEGFLEVDEERIWSGQDRVALLVGNAGGVEVTVNGRPPTLLGEPGEVVKAEWTADELLAEAMAPTASATLSASGTLTPTATLAPASTATPPTATPVPPTPTRTPTSTPRPTATPGVAPTRPPPATSPPTRIVATAIGLDAPVVPVGWTVIEEGGQKISVWNVADYAAGWHKTSAYPGNVGNTVLAGHHNIKGEVFRRVVELEPGDEVDLYVGRTVYSYAVTEKYILKEKGMPAEVRIKNAQWIAPTADERVTLVTCWPYTNNTHRVVVVAKPIP